MKKLIIIIAFLLASTLNSFADVPYFINFNKVLNGSKVGASAQKILQDKVKAELKKFKKIEEDIRKEEAEIISQKKVLSKEEYKKKVETLRKKVTDMQKNKQKSSQNIVKSRNKARQDLVKAVNPIIKKYMEDNKIRLVLDKKSILLGDQNLEITTQIIVILNKEVKSLKLD